MPNTNYGPRFTGAATIRKLVLAACTLLGIAFAQPCAAAVVTFQATGLANLSDPANIFGLGSSAASNQPFTLSITADGGTPGAAEEFSTGYSIIYGTTPTSSPVRATLTINGVSYVYLDSGDGGSNSHNYVNEYDDGQYEYYGAELGSAGGSFNNYLYVLGSGHDANFLPDADLRNLTTALANAAPSKAGNFYINNGTAASGGTLNITSVAVSVQNSVPELSSWSMMILGMGMAGAAMRHRRGMIALRTEESSYQG